MRMQPNACLIVVALSSTVLAFDVNLTAYTNGINTDGDVICSDKQLTYQFNNLPSFGGILPNANIYPTTCIETDNINDGCEVQFWDDGGDGSFAGEYQCYGTLLETTTESNSKFLIPKAACVVAFCDIDSTTAWGFTEHQEAKCADLGVGDYSGTKAVTDCTQFAGVGLESVFFQAYGNEYTIETYADNNCETNKKTTQGGCLDGVEDNKFYKIIQE